MKGTNYESHLYVIFFHPQGYLDVYSIDSLISRVYGSSKPV